MELLRKSEEKGGRKEEKGVRKGSEDKDITQDLKTFEIQQQEGVMKRDDWQETLKRAMKCLQYIFRFIIRSRQLFVE